MHSGWRVPDKERRPEGLEKVTNLVTRATYFAIQAHKGMKYGELPYEFHLSSVAENLLPNATPEMIAGAWLHDVVEDTDVTLTEIRETFGGAVARIVDGCTDEPGETRAIRKWKTYEKLAWHDWRTKQVKLADRLANMKQSIENEKMRAKYAEEFPQFMSAVGADPQNAELALKLFWLNLRTLT